MAQPGQTTIQLYATSTAAATPSSANLVSGELALNLTDKKVFTKDGSGNVVEMTLSPLNPSYTGTLTGGTGVVNLGSGQFVKDAVGNVGVGATPEAWNSTVRAIHFNKAAVANNGGTTLFTSNCYYNSSYAPIYTATGAPAASLVFNPTGTGGVAFNIAPSGTAGNPITFTPAMTLDNSGNLTPGADNTQTNGSGALRWSTIYAGTGTINTSDAREKTPVRAMAAGEIDAAKALSKEIGVYQFLDSVAAKGDKARHHIGMTVQRAIQIMEAYGLNPFAYGFICYDKWDEQVTEHPAVEARDAVKAKEAVLDVEGNVVEPAVAAQSAVEAKAAWTEVTLKAGDRYSFRYDQLTLFIARGIHARLEALEAK